MTDPRPVPASRVVLLSVVCSVLASAITAVFIASLMTDDAVPLTSGPPDEPGPSLAGEADGAIVDPARRKAEAIEILLALEDGERKLELRDALDVLVKLGDEVVPDLVDLLRSGRDREYSKGVSTDGSTFRRYPRLRTIFIDVLRLIGTPAAKRGILETLGENASLADHRDLLVLYQSTKDEVMKQGISEMLPELVEMVREVGMASADEEAIWLTSHLVRWIRQYRPPGTVDLIEPLAEDILLMGGPSHVRAFGLLVELSPERAVALVEKVRDASGKSVRVILSRTMLLGAPLTRVARFYELLLPDLDADSRRRIHMDLPMSLCRSIEDLAERAADGRRYLEFLGRILEAETDEWARRSLAGTIKRLEEQIERIDKH
jgi:hypothetical protein